VVYPSIENGMSPFDTAVKRKSPKSIEAMLEMLISLPDLRVGKFIRKHYTDLFASGLNTFDRYLDSCMFKHPRMMKTEMFKWEGDEEEMLIDHHTGYLGDDFKSELNQKLGNGYFYDINEALNKALENKGGPPNKSGSMKVAPGANSGVNILDQYDDVDIGDDDDDTIKRVEL
jgi:hypothetical protein